MRLQKAGFTCKNKSYTYTEGNRQHSIRYSVVAMRNNQHRLVAPICYEDTMTKDFFESYLKTVLPLLPHGSTVVLDNASSHKYLQLDSVLHERKFNLKDLPLYSPQLNPIEQLWASVKQKLKSLYRYVKENFFEALCDAITYYSIDTSGPSR